MADQLDPGKRLTIASNSPPGGASESSLAVDTDGQAWSLNASFVPGMHIWHLVPDYQAWIFDPRGEPLHTRELSVASPEGHEGTYMAATLAQPGMHWRLFLRNDRKLKFCGVWIDEEGLIKVGTTYQLYRNQSSYQIPGEAQFIWLINLLEAFKQGQAVEFPHTGFVVPAIQ